MRARSAQASDGRPFSDRTAEPAGDGAAGSRSRATSWTIPIVPAAVKVATAPASFANKGSDASLARPPPDDAAENPGTALASESRRANGERDRAGRRASGLEPRLQALAGAEEKRLDGAVRDAQGRPDLGVRRVRRTRAGRRLPLLAGELRERCTERLDLGMRARDLFNGRSDGITLVHNEREWGGRPGPDPLVALVTRYGREPRRWFSPRPRPRLRPAGARDRGRKPFARVLRRDHSGARRPPPRKVGRRSRHWDQSSPPWSSDSSSPWSSSSP